MVRSTQYLERVLGLLARPWCRGSLGQSSEHQLNHGNLDHRFTGLGEVLVVLAQTTVSAQPTEGPLDNPAPWQDMKTDSLIAPFHDFQDPLARGFDPLDQLTRIGTVGPN